MTLLLGLFLYTLCQNEGFLFYSILFYSVDVILAWTIVDVDLPT